MRRDGRATLQGAEVVVVVHVSVREQGGGSSSNGSADAARLREGTLAQTPFPVVLHTLFAQKRTAVLELSRGPLEKQVVFDEGVPVECKSNLLHETLGKFLVARGKLSEDDYQRALAESAASGQQYGEVLTRLGLVTPFDLFKQLQQSLAQKLLDLFTWQEGKFRVASETPDVQSPLNVVVPQLLLTGVLRYAPQSQVEAAIAPLVGKALALHPSPAVSAAALKLGPKHARALQILKRRPRIDELMAEGTLAPDEVMRLVAALSLLGVVVRAEDVPAEPVAPAPAPIVVAPVAAEAPPTAVVVLQPMLSEDELARRRNEVMAAYLSHRKLDAFDLLGVPVDAPAQAIKDGYLAFAARFAPEKFAGEEMSALREKAVELFLAGAKAYGQLTDVDQKSVLVLRRRAAAQKAKVNPAYAIRTDLLDAESQFKEGKARMEAGKTADAIRYLEFAADCDPKNGVYRAELAYCRFIDMPAQAKRAAAELAEVLRMDPECGVAALYAGLVWQHEGDVKNAELLLRRAAKQLVNDRRPVDALRDLLKGKR